MLVPLQGAAGGRRCRAGCRGRVLLSECCACFALGSGAARWVLVPLQGAASRCCCCVRLAGAAAGRHRRVLLSECCAR